MTVTRSQSIAPSCGSVTVTEYGIPSPQSKKLPSTGVWIVTVGAVLPTTISIVLTSVLPAASLTVSRAV